MPEARFWATKHSSYGKIEIRKNRAASQVPAANAIAAITSHNGSDPPGSSSSAMPSF
jgi:hypothetical protein